MLGFNSMESFKVLSYLCLAFMQPLSNSIIPTFNLKTYPKKSANPNLSKILIYLKCVNTEVNIRR